MGKSLKLDEVKKILLQEVEKFNEQVSYFSTISVDGYKKNKIQENLDRLESKEKQLKERKESDFDEEIEKLLKDEGITRNMERKGDYFKVFRLNFIKIEILKIKWEREVLLGKARSQIDLVSQIMGSGFEDLKVDKKNAFARDTHLQSNEPTELEI